LLEEKYELVSVLSVRLADGTQVSIWRNKPKRLGKEVKNS